MPTLPVDVVNRALDECGIAAIGDLEDGSTPARAATRIYVPTLRQLLSAAHWNFARAQVPMVLLGDVTGIYSTFQDVPGPWVYMYDWPIDCVHARWVPRNYNNAFFDPSTQTTPGTPVTSGTIAWSSPSPFLITSVLLPNDVAGEWYNTEGHDPEQTKVILSNQLSASLVYTKLMQYPDAWDALFEQAMVAVLSARLAMPLIADKAFARQVRADNVQLAKSAIDAARVRDGDEGWTVQNHTPDWIRARTSDLALGGPGILYNSWASMPMFEDAGAAY